LPNDRQIDSTFCVNIFAVLYSTIAMWCCG